MKKSIIIIVICLLIFITGYILFIHTSYVPKQSSFHADINSVRKLCADTSELPVAINTLITGKGELLKWTIAAGDNSLSNQYVQTSFQIVYNDKTIILDTPMDKKQFHEFKNVYEKQFFEDAHQMLEEAMKQSSLIIFTHEHGDHMGGLAKSFFPDDLYKKAIVTKEQYDSRKIKKADFPPEVLTNINPLKYDNYYKVAPGIIMIKAPGHTEGHQMVYVKLKDGKEFLFTGDIVWNYNNIVRVKNRPILVTLAGGENCKQLGHLIRWLHNSIYKNDTINIHIIPSHDPEVINSCIKEGLLGESFTF